MKGLIFFLLTLTSSAMAINPERDYKWTPDMRGLNYHEYQIKTSDNFLINVWEYEQLDPKKTNRTIILVGPDGGNMGYLIWQAKAFVAKGFRVITFDYRGFGKSADFTIHKDFLFYNEFSLDLDSIINATRRKFPTDQIGLYAISMGTYVSLLRKEKVDFLVAEGFFHHPQKVVDRIKVNKGKTVLLPLEAKPINRTQTPTLIFCASHDQTTMTVDAKEYSSQHQATIVEFDGNHLDGMNIYKTNEYGDQYVDIVLEFLKGNGL